MNISLPFTAPIPLPPVSAGLTLTHVVIGRGTQNYTCADSTKTTIPVAAGALATLFNATCMSAPFPQIVSMLPTIALKFPVPSSQLFLSGHHFFSDSTTPTFSLTTPEHNWGSVWTKKNAAAAAPNPATDVPWLKLTAKTATGCTISEVYRVDTAGGVAPPTCEGQPKNVEVQYAAVYWMYSKPAQGY
jgi:hypothetical protein